MKRVKKTMVISAAVATLYVGVLGTAQADVMAQSILTINNFRLLHANGTAFTDADFALLDGDNMAHAQASLNGATATAVPQTISILSGLTPDLAHQLVGLPNPPRAENNFSPFPSPPAMPGTFGYADQHQRGSAISLNGAPSGASAQTRADTALQSAGFATGDAASATSVVFVLEDADSLTFTFDATPFTQAYTIAGPAAYAVARLSWSLNLVNQSTGETVYVFRPSALNDGSTASRTSTFAGLTTYNPGTLSFTATSPLLNNFELYQLTIGHYTLANALESEGAVPEPATLAIFGLGLLGMTAFTRRRARK